MQPDEAVRLRNRFIRLAVVLGVGAFVTITSANSHLQNIPKTGFDVLEPAWKAKVPEWPANAESLMKEQQSKRERTLLQHSKCSSSSNRATTKTTTTLSSNNNNNNDDDDDEPSIAFLFLSGDGSIPMWLDDIWERWFPPVTDKRYSVWVHTKPGNSLGPFLCRHAIPNPVQSEYWWLHETTMQLLTTAYHNDIRATHFVFVSATSIPLQPFDRVYNQLVQKKASSSSSSSVVDQSCVCMMEGYSWTQARGVWNPIAKSRSNKQGVAVGKRHQSKAELWSSYTRAHVQILLEHAPEMETWNKALKEFASTSNDQHPVGAPYEMFFPTLLAKQGRPRQEFSEKHGKIKDPANQNINFIKTGCCTHYISWDDTVYSSPVTRKCTKLLGSPPAFPCAYQNLLLEGVRTISEDYMFLRKVWHGTTFETQDGKAVSLMEGLELLEILQLSDNGYQEGQGPHDPA